MTLTIADTRGLRADDGVVSSSTPGERGGLLRREGLYHSHIIEWRKARDAGTLVARPTAERPEVGQDRENEQTTARRRRRGPTGEQAEVERLRRQNEKLAKDLARTQAALDIMGKAHALLELLSESAEPTREQGPSK